MENNTTAIRRVFTHAPKKIVFKKDYVYTSAEKDILPIYVWYKENYFEEPSEGILRRAITLLNMYKGDLEFVKYEVENWMSLDL